MEEFKIELSKTCPFPVTFKLVIDGEPTDIFISDSYVKKEVLIDCDDEWSASATIEIDGKKLTTAGYGGTGTASICAIAEGSPNGTLFFTLRIGHYHGSQDWITYPVPGGRYQHYRGGIYEVLHLAQDTVTEKTVVVYRSLHHGSFYTRPLEQWFEKISGPYQETRFKEITSVA